MDARSQEDDKIEVVLAQWQTCVEMANSVSQRRDVMNNIFITLNLAIVTATSVAGNLKTAFMLIAGIATCIIWLFFIENYKALNTEKFKVINEIEQNLPAQPFNEEWEGLRKNKRYMDGTKLEKILPVAFIIIYVAEIILICVLKLASMRKGIS